MFYKGKQCEDTGVYNQTTCKEAKEKLIMNNETECDIHRDVQIECHKTCGFCGILFNNFIKFNLLITLNRVHFKLIKVVSNLI